MMEDAVLDETDYSNREHDATVQNIGEAAWRLKQSFALADGWEVEVFSWLWDHNDRAIENTDDQGG
jgi:hypothetical protein